MFRPAAKARAPCGLFPSRFPVVWWPGPRPWPASAPSPDPGPCPHQWSQISDPGHQILLPFYKRFISMFEEITTSHKSHISQMKSRGHFHNKSIVCFTLYIISSSLLQLAVCLCLCSAALSRDWGNVVFSVCLRLTEENLIYQRVGCGNYTENLEIKSIFV